MIQSGAETIEPIAIKRQGLHPFDRKFIEWSAARRDLPFVLALHRATGWPIHVIALHVGRHHEVQTYYVMDDRGRVLAPNGIMGHGPFSFTWFQDIRASHSAKIRSMPDPGELPDPLEARNTLEIIPLPDIAEAAVVYSAFPEKALIADLGRGGILAGVESEVIAAALGLIRNRPFTDEAGKRLKPRVESDDLNVFTRKRCMAFSEALLARPDRAGLRGCILAEPEFFERSPLTAAGFHSAVFHPDGEIEDAWGKRTPSSAAQLFGMKRWVLSADAYASVRDDFIRSFDGTPGFYERRLSEATRLIEREWSR
ncbi:hypothetical protein SAE02_77550 [Skermanella aerolata]|uniref:Uncharacterized protein n=1 Tax=Skermanella aerolata TaxID=393310 RepID=A0A512E4H2_9PROT|nr:hypothetical protein [Skermanella aerolata]KJB89990.1 hypothetical protein N826_08740 [Skermanella aerolata KACC 11604]GEO43607.1 hypothetical protein SAE02_77550 [Skermanella aerolata]